MCDTTSCGGDPKEIPVTLKVPGTERRAFLRGLISLPLAAVLADPGLARAAGEGLEHVSLTTPGGGASNAYLARPENDQAPAVLLIHEWWGLNDHIKAVAAEYAKQGFLALAVDLYDGKVATTREDAKSYMQAVDPNVATEALSAWVGWLREHTAGNRKVGTVGWCFGGGWWLNASIAAPVDATVIYYGNVAKSADDVATLNGPVLGHFATLDGWINTEMVGGFQKAMMTAGKTDLTIHWYVANHAFANPSGGRYDEEDAALSWARTLSFFHQHLG